MEKQGKRRIFGAIAAGLVLGIGAGAAPLCSQEAAAAGGGRDFRWIVRGGPAGLFSTGDEAGVLELTPALAPGERTERSITDEAGLGIELEYLVRRKIGIELTALFGDFGVDFLLDTGAARSMASEDIGFGAVALGVNYHVTPGARADFFVGAFAQSSSYDDVTFRLPAAGRTAKLRLDDDVGFGFRAGVDVPFKPGSPWLFTAGLRHLRGPLDVKPIVLSLGVGHRF